MGSKEKEPAGKFKGKERLVSVVLLLLFWMVLSLPHSVFSAHGLSSLLEHFILGILLAFLVTRLIALPVFTQAEIKEHRLPNILRLISYVFYLIGQMIKAGFDVARRVMRAKPDISPGIIKVNTRLCDDWQISINGNSITLTPGTITLDVEKTEEGCTFWVHSISKEGLNHIKKEKGFVNKILKVYK